MTRKAKSIGHFIINLYYLLINKWPKHMQNEPQICNVLCDYITTFIVDGMTRWPSAGNSLVSN